VVIFSLSAAVFAAGFSGCEKRIEAANIDTINRMQEAAAKNLRGLTPKEVESVLGEPDAVEKFTLTRPAVKELAGQRITYKKPGQDSVTLHFVEGQLVRDVQQFGTKEPASPDEAKAPNSGAKMPVLKP
jgi:outer membrane protein assembly factor BamE (lipoprotein component of BamABCDE complex)